MGRSLKREFRRGLLRVCKRMLAKGRGGSLIQRSLAINCQLLFRQITDPRLFSFTVSFSFDIIARISVRACSAPTRQEMTRSSAQFTMYAFQRFSCPSFLQPGTNRRTYRLLNVELIGDPSGGPLRGFLRNSSASG
jgi:hypothetical protein